MPVDDPAGHAVVSPPSPWAAISVPIAVAPFGYLVGGLFVSHLVQDETMATWMSTVTLTTVALFVLSVRS